jgi:hypothetical protein
MTTGTERISMWYRLSRGALRAGIELWGRPVRLLGMDRVPETAAILAVCRPPRLLDALILVAGFERPIHCVVPDGLLRGPSRILSRAVGMVSYRKEAASRHSAVRAGSEMLGAGEVLAVFVEAGVAELLEHHAGSALSIAREAWASAFPEQDPLTLPVHTFWPAGRGNEILVHVGDPLNLGDDGGPAPHENEEISLSAACPRNVFALDQDAFERLLKDVEEALLDRLEKEWHTREGWKQKTEGFRLSAAAAEQLRRLNQTRPEDLVALKGQFDTCRELRRRRSLTGMRADVGRKQFSSVQRLLVWIETVAGLPLALWGIVNHAAIALLLYLLGLTSGLQELQAGRWAARALVIVGCYVAQIALVSHWMGRAAAGYYAVTLPVSGAYLWRYAWLLRRRASLLLLGARAKALHRLAEARWRLFLTRLDDALTVPVKIAAGGPKP